MPRWMTSRRIGWRAVRCRRGPASRGRAATRCPCATRRYLRRNAPGLRRQLGPRSASPHVKSAEAATRPRATTPLGPSDAETGARRIAREATSLEALETALRNFDGCGLKTTATKLCFYRGAPQAPLMIIGEAPGRDEDLEGKPFVGRAGKLLDKMLAAIGLTRGGRSHHQHRLLAPARKPHADPAGGARLPSVPRAADRTRRPENPCRCRWSGCQRNIRRCRRHHAAQGQMARGDGGRSKDRGDSDTASGLSATHAGCQAPGVGRPVADQIQALSCN